MSERTPAASLKLWLLLALGLIAIVPTLTAWGLAQATTVLRERADQARWAAIRQTLGSNAAPWHDPAWQRRAGAAFAAQRVDVLLADKRPSQLAVVFETTGASQLLRSFGLAPSATARQNKERCGSVAAGKIAGVNAVLAPAPNLVACDGSGGSVPAGTVSSFRTIAVASPSAAGRPPAWAIADIWLMPNDPVLPSWAPLLGGSAALLLTLAVAALLLRRLVLLPLAAMSQAARQIAAGDLNIRPPRSSAREVAEVATALRTMSVGLRDAIDRQSDLEQERRLFIGAIAHDLRSPLFTLSGYLSGLREGLAATPEKAMHYVEVCQEQSSALERLVADLFAYTRMEYLAQEPRREPVDLGEVLGHAAEHLALRADARAICLELAGPETPCTGLGDTPLLIRAVENLLDNALQHTPAGGRVTLRWRQEGAMAVFSVEDTGPGIAPHDLPQLFTPLFRGETSPDQQTGGAGLGLTIARRILRAHGGDLTAANGPAGGAIFTGMLPIDGAAAPRAHPRAPDTSM